MNEVAYAISTQAQLPGENALVLLPESHYVTETATGLTFREDTPLEVWSSLVARLIVARQRVSFALADAINFGRDRYGEEYAQWVDETGLQETTLMNVAWVGRQVPISRRREGIDFTYHQAVAPLAPADQDRLLDETIEKGWKRYQLREAVKKVEASSAGTVAEATSEPAPMPLSAADLTDEARQAMLFRAAGVGARHRTGFEAGFVAGLKWADQRDCFREWRDE